MILSRARNALKELKALGATWFQSTRGRDLPRNHPFCARGKALVDRWPPPPGPVLEAREASAPNRLRDYFEGHAEGPGLWKFWHYFDVYHRHFAKFVGREVHIAEIGVFSGGSLRMWREYFGDDCHVYGIDIREQCKAYQNDHTKILIGDQADREFWARFKSAVPKLDIVVDDGGHTAEQQVVSAEELLPHLRPGGVYLCEDVVGSVNGFSAFVHGLSDGLNAFEPPAGERTLGAPRVSTKATNFQAMVHSIHSYPLAVVIERREKAVVDFVAPKHGTEWMPPDWLR